MWFLAARTCFGTLSLRAARKFEVCNNVQEDVSQILPFDDDKSYVFVWSFCKVIDSVYVVNVVGQFLYVTWTTQKFEND